MSADHPPPLSATERIGAYQVLARLGEGGMGQVYKARDLDGRLVAIKVIRPEYAALPEFRRRFEREVRNAQRVPGHWTAEMLGASLDGDLLYMVTEFIDGRTLAASVAQDGPWSGARLQRLGHDTAEALRAIHGAGVIHRDLKPSNVLLSESGVRVIDFGIARAFDPHATLLTATGQVVGTPGFIAPEVHAGRAVTAAADVFAWGGVMAYAATGRYAFGSDAREAIVERVMREAPDLAGLDHGLLGIVSAALAKDPAARPAPEQLLAWLTGASAPPGPQPTVSSPGWTPSGAPPAAEADAEAEAEGGLPSQGSTSPANQPVPSAPAGPATARLRRWRRLAVLPGVAVLLVAAIVAALLLQGPARGPRRDPGSGPGSGAASETTGGAASVAGAQSAVEMRELVDRLGSDRLEVQIDAINALEQIARQQPENRLPVIDALSAYLHRRVPYPPDPQTSESGQYVDNTSEVQAILTVLGRRPVEPPDPRLDLTELVLRGADLTGANLTRADLGGSDLLTADLSGANLTEANLGSSILGSASLHDAILRDASIRGVDLTDAGLIGADLRGANLHASDLRNARLNGADLRGANLNRADLRGAALDGADLRDATYGEETLWPDGFDWQSAGVMHCADTPQGWCN